MSLYKEEFKEIEEKFRFISEHTSDMICLHNLNGVIIYAPSSSKEILGYESDQVLGRKIVDFIEPSYLKDMDRQTMINLFNSKGRKIRYKVQHKSGAIRWLESISNNISNAEGEATHVISSTRDITENVHLFDDLMEALSKEKELADLKSRFVSMASHEFKTPLSTIQANADILDFKLDQLDEALCDQLRKPLKMMVQEIERLNSLIDDILILGRMEAGRTPFNPKKIDAEKLISQIAEEEFNRKYPGRKVVISSEGKMKKINADPVLLKHILVNLLSNSYKYSREDQSPMLHVAYKNEKLVIQVIDHGIGIPEEDQRNLFTSFYRAKNVENIQGIGMGLTIVKEFVEMHKGRVNVESEINRGTTFTIQLPYN